MLNDWVVWRGLLLQGLICQIKQSWFLLQSQWAETHPGLPLCLHSPPVMAIFKENSGNQGWWIGLGDQYSNNMVPSWLCVCVCVTGLIPMLSRSTLVIVHLVDKLDNKSWEAKIIEQKDTRIKLSINTPPTAPIGHYQLSVITWTPKGSNTYSCKPENDIYLLFNPWCKGKHGQK